MKNEELAEVEMFRIIEYNILAGLGGYEEFWSFDEVERLGELDEIFYSVITTKEFQDFDLSNEDIEKLHTKVLEKFLHRIRKNFLGMFITTENGSIECPKCGNLIEPDCDKCGCGWRNPIFEAGLI